ncbi:Eco57I restriction-modification methylase domain-containing protein [Thalassotalea euphylliae]|nr:N-6 DNA methylase [Thalassotalea euphylliae]
MNQHLTDKSFQGYFTDAEDLRNTMIHLLGDVSEQTILEPCFGEGAFIKNLLGTPSQIDAIDIDESHFKNHLTVNNCNYYHLDYIDYFVRPDNRNNLLPELAYDSTICNPPYGLKFTKDYRKLIKKSFPNTYAKESYALFFYFAIQQLKKDGRYVFIIPDTFMTSTHLRYMRDFIIAEAKPTHVFQFKSKRFGSVNFGYGNMCIIAGNRAATTRESEVVWVDAVSSDQPLLDLLAHEKKLVTGEYLINNAQDAWISPTRSEQIKFSRETVSLGEIAECRTGIYTGNNQMFCGYDVNKPPKRVNGHPVNWDDVTIHPSDRQRKTGIDKNVAYVPFVRGGHRKVFESANSCIRWDIDAIAFYDNDKKARLQNRDFYFRTGLAIPMVTSGRLSASEMKDSIFDQGVVGVFSDVYHDFLLIYLNDPFATKQKSLIAPGANNSANYLKKIKVPALSDKELDQASKIVNQARETGWYETKKMREEFIASVL